MMGLIHSEARIDDEDGQGARKRGRNRVSTPYGKNPRDGILLIVCLENNTLILIIKYVHLVVLYDIIPEFSITEETIQSAIRYPSDLTDEEGEILKPIINELEFYTTRTPTKK